MSNHDHGPAPSLTRNQTLVMEALEEAKAPLSAYTILDLLRDQGFRAPLQVYRALDKLIETGLVHRLESLNAFVACTHPGCDGHGMSAFMICNACGSVRELSDRDIERRLATLASQAGFKTSKTAIELRGTCQNCAVA